MNIFSLSPDAEQSAAWHCDQHLAKMITESAQMASIAARALRLEVPAGWLYRGDAYSLHPCTRWAGASTANLAWLCRLARALDSQRDSRLEHASIPVIRVLQEALPNAEEQPASWVFAGPEDLRSWPDVHTAYQEFYRRKQAAWAGKRWAMSWKGRQVPDWMKEPR